MLTTRRRQVSEGGLTGNQQTSEDLGIQQQERLVRHLAGRFAGLAEREDLEQVARLALWQAWRRFDPARGCRFSTFALPTVQGELLHYLRDQGPAVRIPRSWWDLRPRLKREADAFALEQGREPTVDELAVRLGVSEEDVTGALGVSDIHYAVSLDEPHGGPEGEETEPLTAKIGASDPRLEAVELRVMVRQSMERLPARLRDILERRYFGGLSQNEVGRQLGISQMHVSRLEHQALAQMRQELRQAWSEDMQGGR
jgi:RNA polymerase sigma-B factor